MKKRDKIIGSGPFKGKKIEFASTSGLDGVREICEEFMERIFDFSPGDYLITDESSLRDFADVFEPDLKTIYDTIRSEYGFDVSHIASGNLLEIFRGIRQSDVRSVEPWEVFHVGSNGAEVPPVKWAYNTFFGAEKADIGAGG